MLEVYKLVSGKYDPVFKLPFDLSNISVTRGNKFKLSQHSVKYDLRKNFFTNRVVRIWNSLPDTVVSASNLNTFKNRIDKFWENQALYYDWQAELTGIGNRSSYI